MSPGSELEPRVRDDDPPLIIPGMADVITDPAGHLVELVIVPPRFEPPPQRKVPVDWTPFLDLVGLTGPVSPAASFWSAPVDSDEKRAWIIGSGDARIEAAAYHGKPVWFAVIPSTTSPRSLQTILKFTAVSATIMIVLTLVYIITAVVLANRNLRRGQGDRRSATAIAIFIFVLSTGAVYLRAHHPPDILAEAVMLLKIASFSTLLALLAWLGYVAIEPLIRRRWPGMMIGWSRLFEGRFRDPMIGRDLLVGGTASILMAVAWQAGALLPGSPPQNMVFSALSDLREIGFFIGYAFLMGITGAMIAATTLLALHVLTRNLWVSVFLYALASSAFFVGDATGPAWYRILYGAVAVSAALAIFFRFGLLALSWCAVPFFILRTVPVTLDTNAWYFGRSAFVLLLLAGFALYGFVVSLGGKRWLPELAIEG